jgi:hypothetical protein
MATTYAKAIDQALRPHGFIKSGNNWTRVRGDMWECVNRQSSWLGGVTVNLEMKDLETERIYVAVFGSEVSLGLPPISQRIGHLIGNADRWWSKDEVDGPADLADAVVKFGLPWFDRVRTLQEQAENWYGRSLPRTGRRFHAFSMIVLALTLYRMGEIEEACGVLRTPVPKIAGASVERRFAKVREWIGCDQAAPAR